MTARSSAPAPALSRLCLAALLWCIVGLTAHWAFAGLACGGDTTNCALSHDKNGVYRGVLADAQGRALTNTSFSVAFASRQTSSPRDVSGFSTDANGDYCIVWAEERITPFLQVSPSFGTSLSEPWKPLNGASPPHGCQSGNQGIPWNHASDLKRTPQFVSVIVLGIASALLLLVGLTFPAFAIAGLTLTTATTALGAILWIL
jgi:hypothetical protein